MVVNFVPRFSELLQLPNLLSVAKAFKSIFVIINVCMVITFYLSHSMFTQSFIQSIVFCVTYWLTSHRILSLFVIMPICYLLQLRTLFFLCAHHYCPFVPPHLLGVICKRAPLSEIKTCVMCACDLFMKHVVSQFLVSGR